jgi:hypothetical protein
MAVFWVFYTSTEREERKINDGKEKWGVQGKTKFFPYPSSLRSLPLYHSTSAGWPTHICMTPIQIVTSGENVIIHLMI